MLLGQQISYTIQAKLVEAYTNFLIKFSPNFPISPPDSFFQSPVVVSFSILFSSGLTKTILFDYSYILKIQKPIYGDINPQFVNYMAPGIMISIIFTITIGLTGLMFVIEKKEGLLDRSWVAGVHTIEIMFAHITSKLAIMLVQITCMLVISSLAFNIKINGPIALSALLLLLQGFCGMSYGLAISAKSNDETQVMQVAVGSVFPAMIVSGIIWPLQGMPTLVKYISYASPLTLPGEAMRSVVSRGWGFTYPLIWIGIATSIGWSLFFNIIAMILFEF